MSAALELALRRDRVVVLGGLAGVVVVAWLYLVHLAGEMAEMEVHAAMGMAMPQMQPWGGVDLRLLFVMWAVMMAAMMTPSASPMILMFATINRRRAEQRGPVVGCRSPMGFIMTVWREGVRGALIMGWRHGLYCVGCCWVLMALLFVPGVMNLLWVAAITAFVLAEKMVPAGKHVSRLAGVVLVLAGLAMVVRA